MSTIRLTWNSVEGAVSYNIYHATKSGLSLAFSSLLANVNSNTTTYDHINPTPGHNFYIISAIGPNNEIGPPSNEIDLTVDAILLSINVTPPNPSIVAGNTQQFTATGTYNDSSTVDITSTVTWASGTTSVGTINSAGLFSAILNGSSVVSATLGLISGTTTATVTRTLTSIVVTPDNTSVNATGTQQYTATGQYNDGSTADITGSVIWSSSNTSAATISAGGLASGVATGSTTITATSGLISGNTGLTVSAVTCGFAVSPAISYGNTSGTGGVYVAPDGLNGWVLGNTNTMYRTTDGGITWATETLPSLTGGSYTLLRGTSAINVFLGVNGSSSTIAYVHTDGGGTWTSVAAGTTTDGYTYAGIQSVVGNASVLYGVSRNFGPHHYVLKSIDNGATWTFQWDAKATSDSVSSNSSCAWYDNSTSLLWVCGVDNAFTSAVVWKWDGTTLTRMAVTGTDTFASIWSNGSNVYAGGNSLSASFVSIWHSSDNGSSWTSSTQSQLNGSAEIDYIYGNSANDIYVLGSNKFNFDYGMILHGNGNDRWIDLKTGNSLVPGGTTGAVNHYSAAGGTSSSETIIGGDGYVLKVVNCAAPTITGIAPDPAGVAGTNLVITGTNFDPPLEVFFSTIGNITTTIKSTSNGVTLPTTTINVNDTTGFASTGIIYITTDAGIQQVMYSSTTLTSFGGCSGGTGTMSTNNAVQLMNVIVNSATSITVTVPTGYTSGDILHVDTINGSASITP